MVHIAALGIGYGTKDGLAGYSFLPPEPLSEVRKKLAATGVAIRDVLGFIPVNWEQPHLVSMMENHPDKIQIDTAARKSTLGNITPPGGKIEGLYKTLAEAGIISIETAYAARGFVGEADEFGCPNPLSLMLLNRIPGIPPRALTSPNSEDLYVCGKPVRTFRYFGGTCQQIALPDPEFRSFEPLTHAFCTYSIGLDPSDQKNGKPIATAAANLWIPATRSELRELSRWVTQYKPDRISTMRTVDIRDFGPTVPTTVANMVAMGLYTALSPETFQSITTRRKQSSLPKLRDLDAYTSAEHHEDASIDSVVNHFLRELTAAKTCSSPDSSSNQSSTAFRPQKDRPLRH